MSFKRIKGKLIKGKLIKGIKCKLIKGIKCKLIKGIKYIVIYSRILVNIVKIKSRLFTLLVLDIYI